MSLNAKVRTAGQRDLKVLSMEVMFAFVAQL